jgi:hypothetical protein
MIDNSSSMGAAGPIALQALATLSTALSRLEVQLPLITLVLYSYLFSTSVFLAIYFLVNDIISNTMKYYYKLNTC